MRDEQYQEDRSFVELELASLRQPVEYQCKERQPSEEKHIAEALHESEEVQSGRHDRGEDPQQERDKRAQKGHGRPRHHDHEHQ